MTCWVLRIWVLVVGLFLCWGSLLCWWCCSSGPLTFRLMDDVTLLWGVCGSWGLIFVAYTVVILHCKLYYPEAELKWHGFRCVSVHYNYIYIKGVDGGAWFVLSNNIAEHMHVFWGENPNICIIIHMYALNNFPAPPLLQTCLCPCISIYLSVYIYIGFTESIGTFW